MEEIRITPGPWSLNEEWAEIEADTLDGSVCLARLYQDELPDDMTTAFANGRLMAAAPRLISLLARWVERAGGFDENPTPTDPLTLDSRGAIANALGLACCPPTLSLIEDID